MAMEYSWEFCMMYLSFIPQAQCKEKIQNQWAEIVVDKNALTVYLIKDGYHQRLKLLRPVYV